ncbi:hypothetical protein [Sphingomonas radiodurans]|uniref:hypothetical protein n=1 Tax=Sphingomonas radiodurans TaxID=2890321 RepID=UPI001E37EFEE|nr:hypothetical protein [Sphingomonas radiodurans]WBH17183.1 hypothetical protein LLW23_03435 [Sphingomonas radiodurans]
MISIGKVWDRTTEVIAGRFAILAAIALLLLFVPPVVQAAIDATAGTSPAMKFVSTVVGLFVFAMAILGALALTAVATDPAVDQQAALAIGGARIGPMLGIIIVMGLVFFAAVMPGILLIGTSGFDVSRAQAGLSQDALNVGRFGLATVYFLVLTVVGLWLAARLVPLMGVVVNERLRLGAIRRSFALSRGSTLKLIGVLILYSIVFLVVLIAAVSIVGLIARLIFGSDAAGAVAFVVALATAAVTAVFSVLQSVYSAQFYVAARDARGAA